MDSIRIDGFIPLNSSIWKIPSNDSIISCDTGISISHIRQWDEMVTVPRSQNLLWSAATAGVSVFVEIPRASSCLAACCLSEEPWEQRTERREAGGDDAEARFCS